MGKLHRYSIRVLNVFVFGGSILIFTKNSLENHIEHNSLGTIMITWLYSECGFYLV